MEKFLCNQHGDYYLDSINRDTFNEQGAMSFYDSHIAEQILQPAVFYIIIGCDSGLMLHYIAAKGIPQGSRYLFVELDDYVELLQQRKALPSKADFCICREDEWLEQAQALNVNHYLYTNKVRCLLSIGALDAHMGQYHQLTRKVLQTYEQCCWESQVTFMTAQFIDQQMKNIAENKIPAICLENCFSQADTAIMLGGGPSLDDALPWLVKNRQKIFVACVSRISRRLQQVGIMPDMIVMIDPTDKMLQVSHEMLQFQPRPLLVSANSATDLLVCAWDGPHIFLGSRIPDESEQQNIPVIGPTVVNAGLMLLSRMGFGQVLLAGVDLCYSIDGYSHAQGSQEYDQGPRLGFRGQRVLLNDNTWGETEFAFFKAIETLSEQAKMAQEVGCQFVNIAEKAARVDNVAHQSLDAISIMPLSSQPSILLQQAIAASNISTNTQYYRQCLGDIDKFQQQLSGAKLLVKQAIQFNEKLSANPVIKINEVHDKIQRVEKKLKSKFQSVLNIAKIYAYRDFAEIFKVQDPKHSDIQAIYHASKAYFTGYWQGLDGLSTRCDEARQRIQSRLEEEKSHPNMSKLLNQWQADRHYGRAALWQNHHQSCYQLLPAAIQDKFDQFADYYQQLCQPQQKQQRKTANDYVEFRHIFNKLYFLYKDRDSLFIKNLLQSLTDDVGEKSQLLQDLAKGFLAEIDGDLSQAAAYYHQAVKPPVMEFSLNSLTKVLIEQRDLSNALLALEALCHIAPRYLREYAKLCQFTHKNHQAISKNR